MEGETTKPKVRPMHIVLCAVTVGLTSVATWISVTAFPIGAPGISFFFWAIGLMVAFTMWFGIWGAIGCSIGAIIGGMWGGLPFAVALLLDGVTDFIEPVIPALVFRSLALNPELKTRRDWTAYVVASVVAATVGGFIGANVEVWVGWVPGMFSPAFYISWLGWTIGDIVCFIVIGGTLLRTLTGFTKRMGLYSKTWLA